MLVVRIGAIAFHITGINWPQAKFQALSCFTGTGFTTREAELITINVQRRRVASVLMILGNAGLVTLIATLANSIRAQEFFIHFKIPILHRELPSNIAPIVNLIVLALIVYAIFKFFAIPWISRKLTSLLRSQIVEKEIFKAVSIEELWVATGGYGISQIDIDINSHLLNQSLIESKLRKRDITVLAIERKGATIPNPSAEMKMILNDKLICFGKIENIRRNISEDN